MRWINIHKVFIYHRSSYVFHSKAYNILHIIVDNCIFVASRCTMRIKISRILNGETNSESYNVQHNITLVFNKTIMYYLYRYVICKL